MNRLTMLFWLIGACLLPSAGFASYVNQFTPIGFSEDGKVFAFEQYFTEPENDATFVTIVMIDTEKDTYLPGTPIEESSSTYAGLAKSRAKAMARAEPLIKKYKLRSNPGAIVAFAPVTEYDSVGDSLRYYSFPTMPPVGDSYTLKLERVDLPVTEVCKSYDTVDIGFRLVLTEIHGEAAKTVIHEDKDVPESRKCPNGYRLGAVITSQLSPTMQIAMVQVNTFGFEGTNGTWIAVPVPVPAQP